MVDREMETGLTGSDSALPAAAALPPSLPQLFRSFLRVGATSFGGPSMVAYIRKLTVEQKRWMDEGSFLEGVALCQLIPGATAMQTAAYVGFKTRGPAGAAASFIGFGLPAFVFMMILSALYSNAHALPALVSIFKGLRAVIVAIVANATLSFGRTTLRDWKGFAIALPAAILFGFRLNPILVVFLACFMGILLHTRPGFRRSPMESSVRCSNAAPVILTVAFIASLAALLCFRRTWFELAAVMSAADLSAFGGGFASLPLMFHEVVDVRQWMDGGTFLNGVVMGQITPGPIVITATFVGYLLFGPAGGLIATVAVFTPSFLMVVWTAPYFARLLSLSWFTEAAGGVLCSFVGLLLMVTFRFATNVPWDMARILLGGGALAALLLEVDLLWVVLAGALISMVAR